jgi:nickel transport protein
VSRSVASGWRVAALICAAAPAAAAAHEVLHEVEWNRAVAVRASFADGEALAYAPYEVYAPTDPRIPHQKGRTDREGWLAFVPAAPGAWRVRVLDETGHGFEATVEASPGQAAPRAAGRLATAAFVLRPVAALAAAGAAFALLLAVHRRRGATR